MATSGSGGASDLTNLRSEIDRLVEAGDGSTAGAAGAAVGAPVVGAAAPQADRISAAAQNMSNTLLRDMEDLPYRTSTPFGRMSNTDPTALCRTVEPG